MYQALFHKICESRARLLLVRMDKMLAHIKEPSRNEFEGRIENRTWQYYVNPRRAAELAQYYPGYGDDAAIREVFDWMNAGLRVVMRDGVAFFADLASPHYNVVNNARVTTDVPATYKNTVYLFGNCNAVSLFAEDKNTMASHLQRRCNAAMPGKLRVHCAANMQNFVDSTRQILSPRFVFKPGDQVILLSHDVKESLAEGVLEHFQNRSFYQFRDFSGAFQRPHGYGEVVFDNKHLAPEGFAMLADLLYAIVEKAVDEEERNESPIAPYLAPYLKYLAMLRKKRDTAAQTVGAIVMNCNPFTLGHKHLVMEAAKRCDYLYIFVLDEDKSFFPFDDRIAMVKLGLAGVPGISVVPGGKVILSSETMPEYFEKEDIQSVTVDTSHDLTLFATLVAPRLGITKRFAGTEPFCRVTQQYNDGMREMLPRHGVEFVELPRFSVGGREVSASLARECLKNKKFETLQELVPATTYDFLREKGYLDGTGAAARS